MKNSKRVVSVILGLAILGVIGWTVRSLMPTESVVDKSHADKLRTIVKTLDARERKMSPSERERVAALSKREKLDSVVATWTKNGVYTSKEQGIRLSKLGDAALANGTLPPADIEYLIETIRDPQSGSKAPAYIHFHAASDLGYMKTFPADQKERILAVCLPLSKSKEVLDERCAVVVANAMRSKAAVPGALAMLRGSNENNRKAAQKYLDAIGYHPTD